MTKKYELPKLPYAYDALEPHIDAHTMEVHYNKHHRGYLAKLNNALERFGELFDNPIEWLLKDLDSVPQEIREAVRHNGGGFWHHSLFWEMMSPQGGGEPEGKIAERINGAFGGFGEFKEAFTESATALFGSGWTWLVADKNENISIVQTYNQDSPISDGLVPLLGIDVWEHAYYLHYQNRRADYIEAWWNVVDWKGVERNLEMSKNILL